MNITASFRMIPRFSADLVVGKSAMYQKKKIGEIENFYIADEKVMVTVRIDTQCILQSLIRNLIEERPTHIDIESGEIITPERKAG